MERWPGIKKQFKKLGVDAIGISALARTDVRELLMRAVKKLADAPEPEAIVTLPVYRQPEDPREFRVVRDPDGSWRIIGAGIERAAAMTYWEHDGAVRRFQKIMESLGVDDALLKAGALEGDTVHIGAYELEYIE
jgi:GTP-binding protein